MTTFQAFVLGIIQGLTEFLPISSTAHLKVLPDLVGWPDPGAAFTAVIQWGTWMASVVYFRADIQRLLAAFFSGLASGRPLASPDGRLAWQIILGTVPVVAAGLCFEHAIKTHLRSLYVIAGAAIGFALVLLAAEVWTRLRRQRHLPQKDMADLNRADALVVGFAQAFAIIPGASRSGVTITGGLLVGLARPEAARFSFLLSLPAVFGAGLHQLYQERAELLGSQGAVVNLVLATVVSGVVGYATIAFLLRYLKTHSTYLFIAYRLLLGGLLLTLLARGTLESPSL